MLKKKILFIQILIVVLCAAACSDDQAPTLHDVEPADTVTMYITVPPTALSRAGDPGQAVEEGAEWDRLALMITYTGENGNEVPAYTHIVQILSKEDFEKLPSVSETQPHIKRYSLGVEEGDMYVYGVTYSNEAANNPETAIQEVANDPSQTFDNLAISNDYADGNAARFVSVATGYYMNDDGSKKILSVKEVGSETPSAEIPHMQLSRLAAKIDIQWDAADAYPTYQDVAVDDFTFHNAQTTGTNAESGSGRLFPQLATAAGENGQKTFYNTTPVSQRNGRVYHYVFPDGRSTPKVTFTLSAQNQTAKTYTFNFTNPLQKAAWYKVNTTIRGLGNTQTDINISF